MRNFQTQVTKYQGRQTVGLKDLAPIVARELCSKNRELTLGKNDLCSTLTF